MLLNIEGDRLGQALLDTCSSVAALALDFHHYLLQPPETEGSWRCEFGHAWSQDEYFDTLVVFFPKSKALAPYLFALAASHLRPGGTLLIAGENKGGIKSVDKLLGDAFSAPFKLDNARHCLLYSAQLQAEVARPNPEDWVSRYRFALPDGEVTICNMVGVFSDKKLDQGTALLLEQLPTLNGRVLDFGCGAGVIAIALLNANPTLKLECVDINAMALLSCQLSLKANGMNALVYPSDGLEQTQGLFDAIISNPPFHDGLASTTAIATRFVADSKQRLARGGDWCIVANRHLPYSECIAGIFGSVNVVRENNKYKVYHNVTS